MKNLMAQCLLGLSYGANIEKHETLEFRAQTAWIPAKFAQPGHLIRLPDGLIWVVEQVGSFMAADEVRERESDYRYQRRASDV